MEPVTTQTESLGALIRDILIDLRTLVREEIALARVEIRTQATRARAAAVSFGMAIGSLVAGGLCLLFAIAIGIADLFDWPVWAGFLIVAIVLVLVGAVTFAAGRRQLQTLHAIPEETVTTLKENSEWIAKRLSSSRK